MALEEIDLDLSRTTMPGGVQALVTEAEKRVNDFFETEANKRFPRYLPSDFVTCYEVLAAITREKLALGKVFCEWGSGFGVAACIASMLGYEAYGIEIEAQLIDASRALATDFDLPVEFVCTSYIPEGYDIYSTGSDESALTNDMYLLSERDTRPEPVYTGLSCDPADMDIFYVYPWPGELEMMANLFEVVAVEGALLITYQGPDETIVHRKKA